MCAGVEYREPLPSERVWNVYFPSPAAALPVDRGDHIGLALSLVRLFVR